MGLLANTIRLMRPVDWVKNIFVLPAIIFSESLSEPDAILNTAIAFCAFCLLSSGFYALNDVADAASDRMHPIKRKRPVASGDISSGQALIVAAMCAASGIALGFFVNKYLAAILISYGLLQVCYNAFLKRILFVDVVVIAIGFGLRSAAGTAAIEVQMSIWLLACVFFLCLYLGFVKRLCDISSAEKDGSSSWIPRAGYDSHIELNWLLGVSAVLAVVAYLMYALSEHARALFGVRSIGFALLTPLVLIVIHRFYRAANTGTSDSPLSVLRQDKTVIASIILFIVGIIVTLYVQQVKSILETLFVAGVD